MELQSRLHTTIRNIRQASPTAMPVFIPRDKADEPSSAAGCRPARLPGQTVFPTEPMKNPPKIFAIHRIMATFEELSYRIGYREASPAYLLPHRFHVSMPALRRGSLPDYQPLTVRT
ncbi:hypothetical protein, partial [Alistipes sp.]